MTNDADGSFWKARRAGLLVAASGILGLLALLLYAILNVGWLRQAGALLVGVAGGLLVVVAMLTFNGWRGARTPR